MVIIIRRGSKISNLRNKKWHYKGQQLKKLDRKRIKDLRRDRDYYEKSLKACTKKR